MTAAEWLAAARAIDVKVYVDPRPEAGGAAYICRPVNVPGIQATAFDPDRWRELEAELERLGVQSVLAELPREASHAA